MSQLFRTESTVRIGTRTSKLALWQTEHVARLLEARHPGLRCEFVHMVTQGDRRLDRPLPEIGGKGLFTAELEEALRRNEIDLAVHSLKDLPIEDAPGLAVGAVLSREDVRDALVARHDGWTLETLPEGAVVGTSSLRRQAQLLAFRPDLTIRPIRGNVDTRIRKVMEGEYDAAVLAGAGLRRLGLEAHISQWLPLDLMLPAPGQGALAVQCRADDPRIRPLLAAIHEPAVQAATDAERHLLWLLGGGCSAPVAAWAEPASTPGAFTLQARVASTDGSRVANAQATGGDAHEVAEHVASTLRDQGVEAILNGATRPLAGKRVVVTRPQHTVRELVAALQQQGACVVVAPAAQIVPLADLSALDAALEHLDDYHWVVFTSANTVEVVCSRPAMRRVASHAPQVHIAAVGPSTVSALAEQGIAVDFVPSRYDGDLLAAELPLQAGDRILLPRSAIARAAVVDRLQARGARVDEIHVYTTADAPLPPDTLDELRQGWDAITFTSGSTVQGFLAAIAGEEGLVDHLRRGVIACIGPKTADVLQGLGYAPQVVATDHTAAGLVAALADHFDGS